IFIIAPATGLLPGPGGIPVAIAGLALLATEFVWARTLLKGLKDRARALAAHAEILVGARPRLWMVPLVAAGFGAAVGGLIVYEPRWAALIALGAMGPGIAIAYWGMLTFRRWRALRLGAQPGEENPPVPE